jgi:hypothetical protein
MAGVDSAEPPPSWPRGLAGGAVVSPSTAGVVAFNPASEAEGATTVLLTPAVSSSTDTFPTN